MGDVNTLVGVRSSLSRVAYFEALGFRRHASKEWAARSLKSAGYDLDASASALERSVAWSGKSLTSDSDAAVRDGHAVAAKLVAGIGWMETEVSTALSELDTTSQALAGKILPYSATAAETPQSF